MKLPPEVIDIIDRYSTEETAGTIKGEISNVVGSIPLALQITSAYEDGKTHGDWFLNIDGNELRPDSSLSWSLIDQMEESAMPSFAILMKLAPILSVFRSWQGILVKCPSDEELAEVVSENMRQTLPLMAMDFGFRSMVDGVCFMETRYKNTTKFELGIAKNRLPSKLFTVAKLPHIVDPRTVLEIKRTNRARKFDGFIQQDTLPPHQEILVKVNQALVIPNNERFRNLWGVSVFEQMYRPWFWTQVLLRSIVRWGERMAVPTVVATSPMFDTIPNPSDTTDNIKAMDYMASVASSLSRSQYVSIPSDVDPESKKPKYTLKYESSGDAGVSGALVAILQEFTQMVIRSAISADRATTQASGGVGSYAIGSVHDKATQYHNTMILTAWVNYLNKYFLPWLSYYNRGVNGPPIRLEVATIDPSFRDLLMQMLGTMGNTKPGQDALWLLDYPTLLNLAHVPTLDPEVAQKLREKSEEEAMARAEEAMKRQQALAPPPEAAEGRKEQAAKDKARGNEVIKKVEAAADNLAKIMDAGGQVPVYAGLDQVTELIKEARKPIHLQDPDWKESRVSRDPGGRFASKSSSAEKSWDAIQRAALSVFGQLSKFGDKENAKKLLATYGLTDQEMEDALAILENSKRYTSIEEAFDDVSKTLIDGNFADEEDIKKIRAVFFEDLRFEGAHGALDFAQKELMINEDYAVMLLSGEPYAVGVLMHEILHASAMDFPEGYVPSNEFQEKTASWGMPTNANNIEEFIPTVAYTEGRNELARQVAQNEHYGVKGMDANSRAQKAATAALLNMTTENFNEYGDYDLQSYSSEVQTVAQLAIIAERTTPMSASEYAVESNRKGNNTILAEAELRGMFPDRMTDYGTRPDGSYIFPNTGIISSWAAEDYGVERNQRNVQHVTGVPLIPREIEEIGERFPTLGIAMANEVPKPADFISVLKKIERYISGGVERIISNIKKKRDANVGREDQASDTTGSE